MKNWLYKQPLQNPPSIVDIMGRVADSKNLKANWQLVKNIQKSAKVLCFLTENKIASVEDFADTVERTHYRLKNVTDEIKKADRRLDTLATHLAHNDNINAHRAIAQKYKKLKPKKDETALNSLNPFTRNKAAKDYETAEKKYEAYYAKHADAIDTYEAAQQHFRTVMNGRTQLPIRDWQNEQRELAAKRHTLCEEYYTLKEKIPRMEAIRRSVEELMREDVQNALPVKNYNRVI